MEKERSSTTAATARSDAKLISNDKNLMPSMVVKQQRNTAQQHQQQQQQLNHHHQPAGEEHNHHSQHMGPAAGNLDEILLRTREASETATTARGKQAHQTFDQDGLVVPRRVPHHHQLGDGQQPAAIRDLNRELKFNQVRGLSVLDQKSELKRAMEKIEASRRRKEAEQERLTRRSSLELRLEERAQRLAAREAAGSAGESGEQQQHQQASDPRRLLS